MGQTECAAHRPAIDHSEKNPVAELILESSVCSFAEMQLGFFSRKVKHACRKNTVCGVFVDPGADPIRETL